MTKTIQSYTVACSNMDWNYVMRPTVAPLFFQDCFARFTASKHLAAFDLARKGMTLFIVDYDMEFSEELPYWSERFDVVTAVSRVTKGRIVVDAQFVYKSKVFAEGKMTWVIFDVQNRKIQSASDMCAISGIESESLLDDAWKTTQWLPPAGEVHTFTHVVNTTDLDFNGHVNNMAYIHIALSMASEEWQRANFIRRLAVKFQRQAFLGESLEFSSYCTSDPGAFLTRICGGGSTVCQIYSEWSKKTIRPNIADYPLRSRVINSDTLESTS